MNSRMKSQYLSDSVETASPASLLIRLYDRLVLDLERGEQAILAGDPAEANEQLCHAQRIVAELEATLDVRAWSGGESLVQLYRFCQSELIAANTAKDAARVRSVHGILAPLRDAWREASVLAAQQATPATASLSATA